MSTNTANTARLCPGCRSLDGEHDFGETCTLAEEVAEGTGDLEDQLDALLADHGIERPPGLRVLAMPDFAGDIPPELARAAHRNTSFDPERRGAQERASYEGQLAGDFAALSAIADTEEKRATLAEEWPRYHAGYRQRARAHLAAKGRCFSSMITGPANFPKARHEKANRAEERASQELADFRERALSAIRRKLRPEDRPIMAGDSNALDRLRAEIASAEREQEKMRDANAAIRKHAKAGAEAQTAALVALGYTPGQASALLGRDDVGRVGFPDYKLRNNGANVRRMQERLVQLERAKATPAAEMQGTAARLEDDPPANRVRLFFPGKPDAAVRDRLKGAGFRWTPSAGCWQAYRNHGTLAAARDIAGV